MPTAADVTSLGEGEVYRAWLNNLGVNPSSLGKGEALALIADAAAGQGAIGTNDMAPATSVAVTLPRALIGSNTIAVASGTLQLQAFYLTKGQVITNINWLSGGTAGATLTHQWGVVASGPAATPTVVAVTADGTSAAIGANTAITYALSAVYTVPSSGIYYVGVMVANGATQPTFAGSVAANVASGTIPPILGGTSNTGATTPPALGATLTTITPTVNTLYIYLT